MSTLQPQRSRKVMLTPVELELIQHWCARGYTQARVAEAYGCESLTVCRWLQRAAVDRVPESV